MKWLSASLGRTVCVMQLLDKSTEAFVLAIEP